MPTYTFHNTKTNKYHGDFMTISSMEEYLAQNSHINIVPSAPAIVSGVASGTNKPDSGFRDLLKTIKKNSPRSNINTF